MRKGQRLQTLRTSTWKPPTWKNGSTACHRPRPRTRPESTRFDAFDASTRLPQVSSAALGLPVVPEVNIMRASMAGIEDMGGSFGEVDGVLD